MNTTKLLNNMKLLSRKVKKYIPIVEVKMVKVVRVNNNSNSFKKHMISGIKGMQKPLLGVLKYWTVPVVLSTLLLFVTRPSFAQLSDYETRLAQYVVANNVDVGVQADSEGITQIYFDYDGVRNLITSVRQTSANPVTSKEYIAWMTEIGSYWQVFMYHIPSKVTTQLTYSGNNVNPEISEGKVVWEGWDSGTEAPVNGKWQIFLYDGTSILKLTSGDMSLNPDIEGDYVVYGRKNSQGNWRAVGYSLAGKNWVDISSGEKAKYPKLSNKKIKLGLTEGFQEELSLQIDDMFLLQLGSVPLENTQTQSSIDALQAEINAMTATESAIVK